VELRQLSGFVAVAEERNFCRAASRLYVSQPALSRLVKKLEVELGVALFDRSTHHVELTAAGRAFLAQARAALAHADEAARSARRAGQGNDQRLRVGYEDSTEEAVAAALPSFLRRSAEVALSVCLVEGPTNAEALRQHHIDVVVGRQRWRDGGFDSEVVFEEATVVALASGHPLSRSDTIDISTLAEAHTIFVRQACGQMRQRIVRSCEEAGVPNPAFEDVASLRAGALMAAAGLGAVILPISTALSWAPAGIVYRHFDGALSVPLVVSWPSDKPSQTVAALVEALRTSQGSSPSRLSA
jgi:DNA-binding transcriptional LysR family regulator